MKRFVIAISVLVFALSSFAAIAAAQESRRFTVEDLLKVRRVGDPQISPNGKRVAFTIGDVNWDANKVVTQIYVMTIDGGNIKQLTNGAGSATAPRWSPDGKRIAYVTGSQIWTMEDDGHNKDQVTKISTGATAPVWSPDGKWIALTSDVYPDCNDDDCNKKKDEAAESSKVKAHITTRLLFRHWDEWRDVKRTHVFVVSSNGGAARDLTPGDFDSPPYAAATGVDYAFSPDSKELAYVRNPDKVEATSTNSDIYVLPLSGGAAKNITVGNHGYDVGPIYTRDGRYIIYRSQATAGFEADRWPAPLHLFRSFAGAHYLSLGEKLRVAWGLLQLQRHAPADDPPFADWLVQHGQIDCNSPDSLMQTRYMLLCANSTELWS